ncbi:MAG: hypothetical protein JW807_11210 [Spirochaetes bacterium]|nr:hypothetical protein [Spirochaetota bacterium]
MRTLNKKILQPVIILFSLFMLISCYDTDQDSDYAKWIWLLNNNCSGKINTTLTYVDLNGPSEIGASYASRDSCNIYVGSAYPSSAPYIYSISIATNDVTYNSIPRRISNSVIVGKYIWGTEGPATSGFSSIQKINKYTLEVVWSEDTIVNDGRAIAYDGQYVWIADRGAAQKLHRVNPTTHSIESYTGIVLAGARHMTFFGNYLWLTCNGSNAVVRIDPSDRTFTVVSSIPGAWGICYDDTHIIVAGSAGYICKIDPATAAIAQDTTLADCSWLCHCSFDGQYVWITDNTRDEVKIIDHDSLALVETKSALEQPLGCVYDGIHQWVTSQLNIRIEKMTLSL